MPLPFDATLKELVQTYPQDWLAQLDVPPAGEVGILTPDLSALTAFADIVLQVGGVLIHIDFQSGPDADLPRRLLLYNVLLHDQYGLPVHSLVLLLRSRADRSDLTGTVRYEARPGRGGLDFRFEVVRLWQVPVEALLAGGLGVLPLAPLGELPEGPTQEEALPGVIHGLVERANSELPEPEAARLVTAAFVLTGMRVSREAALQMFQGVRAMRDSTTYQYILEEGRVNGIRQTLLRQGRIRFGEPDPATVTALQGITDLPRLEQLTERLLLVSSWQELLETP